MIEALSAILPLVIYFLLIILIILGIVLFVKLIMAMNKVNSVIEDVDNKIKSLNPIFNLIEMASLKVTSVYSKVIDIISGTIEKLFIKNKKGKEDDYE